MGKETINELILELDELIYRKETELKKLENIYYKDDKIRSCLYDEYSKKKFEINQRYKKNIVKIFDLLQKKSEKVRKIQPSLLELSEKNIRESILMPRRIAMGKLKLKSEKIEKDIILPNLLEFPFDKNFIVLDNEEEIIHKLLLRLLYALPLGKIEFLVYDPIGNGKTVLPFNSIFNNPILFPTKKVLNNVKELKDELEKVRNYIRDLFSNKFKEVENWKNYNKYMSSKNAINDILPYKVFIISNIPNGIDNEIFEMFKSILIHSKECGFLVLFSVDKLMLEEEKNLDFNNKKMVMELKEILKKCKPLTNILEYKEENLETRIFKISRIGEKLPQIEKIRELLFKYTEKLELNKTKEQSFIKLISIENKFDRNSINGLKFPIGYKTSNGDILEMSINDDFVHYLIGGRTGSGKSYLLHNLILSLCTRYSPDEVNLYLLDFKDGVEFSKYSDPVLPHGKLIAKEIDVEYGKIVLNEIINEMEKRNKLFKREGCNSFKTYREKTKENLPRIVLIIDEFQDLLSGDDNEEAKAKFMELARKGRNAGIHMVLATQSLGGLNFNEISKQFRGRIVLPCTEEDSMTFLNNKLAVDLKMKEEAIVKSNNGNGDYEEKIKVMDIGKNNNFEYVLSNLSLTKECNDDILIYDGSKYPEFPSFTNYSSKNNGYNLELKLGKKIDYRATDFVLKLNPKVNENLTIYSKDEKINESLLKSIIYSASQSLIKEIIYIGERRIEGLLDENFKTLILEKIKDITDLNVQEELNLLINKNEKNKKRLYIFEDKDITQILGMKYPTDKNEILSYMKEKLNKDGNSMIFINSRVNKNNNGQKITNELSNYMLLFDLNSDEIGRLVTDFKTKNKNFDKRMMYIENHEYKGYMRPFMEGEDE